MPKDLPLYAIIEKNKLASDGAFIWLAEIYLNEENVIRICRNTENIVWNSNHYDAFPFQMGKINDTQDGADPTIELKVDNTTQQIQAQVDEYKGGNGFAVNLILVNTKNLETDKPVDIFYFTVQKTDIDQHWITFVLGTEYSARTRRPLNRYLKNNCPFVYKGLKCGYNGDLESCGKTLVECRNHNNSQRFGGFPGIDQKGVFL